MKKRNSWLPKYSFAKQPATKKEIEKAYDDGFTAGELFGLETFFPIMVYTLNYKLNLGKKRMPDVIRAMILNLDSFRTNQLNPDDYKMMQDKMKKLGIEFQIK